MVVLNDVQVAAITSLAGPLQAQERQAFMSALFEELIQRRHEVGDGELHRTLKDLQRRFFQPPIETEDMKFSCHSRRHGAGLRAFERRA